jgi:hypothetical protein
MQTLDGRAVIESALVSSAVGVSVFTDILLLDDETRAPKNTSR